MEAAPRSAEAVGKPEYSGQPDKPPKKPRFRDGKYFFAWIHVPTKLFSNQAGLHVALYAQTFPS
jgi:hypothetical protein